MNRIVLIKEGEYRPSLFSDFVETVNRAQDEQVGFYTRHDYTFRITRNRSNLDPTCPIALAHYSVDVANQIQDPNLFRPIDTEAMFTALTKYDYVMFGAIHKSHLVTDQNLFVEAMYISRNADGKLVNSLTDEPLQPDSDSVIFISTFLSMVRLDGLPVYAIILNPTLTHVTDGFDYYHTPASTLYSIATDNDGPIRDVVFAPKIAGAQQFGSTLLVHGTPVTIEFFSPPASVMQHLTSPHLLTDSIHTIDTDMEYTIDENTIIITPPLPGKTSIKYFTISFECGRFFDVTNEYEQPIFRYLIITP